MNGDISLSQSLGGLRIANPDEDPESTPSPQSSPPASRDNAESALQPAVSSTSQSSYSTITDRQDSQSLPPIPSDPDGHSLGFNPTTYNSTPAEPSAPPSPALLAEQQQVYTAQLQPRPSMTMDQQASQQPEYPSSTRNYNASSAGPRPASGIYHHSNVSSSSQSSARTAGPHRYREDAMGYTPGVSRSTSRSAAVALQGGMPSREPSRRERAYPKGPVPGGGGPLPPRRSSQRLPLGGGYNGPYGAEGVPRSTEDWQERGAAVATRQEYDSNGKPVSRVVKKGVMDFNFGRILGEGSYSTVIAATDRTTLREYAIKVLDKKHIIKEKKVKYVNIEKDTLNRLTDHPGIVRLYYTFQDQQSLYFVLDLASGGELLGFLKRMTTFDVECTRFYGAQILDAVDYMHSRGVIHRDLKPENVLLDDQMHVKITDFGTAKILDVKKPNGSGSISGDPMDGAESDRAVSFVGTAEYVSPELLTDKNACKASDLWAFGCIIYQLLAGRPPFKAANEYLTFQKIVALDYTFPDGFPSVARDLVERLLVLDPAKRLPIEHIKSHPFFEGIVWGKGLWKQKAPRLKSYVPPSQEPIRLNGPSTAPSSNPPQRPPPRLITELPPPSQLDIDWSPVLTRNNERILKLGNLIVTSYPASQANKKDGEPEAPKKLARFFGGATFKKRQRLVMITSSARVIMAAAGGEEKKAKLEISLLAPGVSWRSQKDSKGLTSWVVDTRDKRYVFEDPKATTSDPDGSKYSSQEWLDALEQAKDFALAQSAANSYSADSNLTELNSALSGSPASTIGGDSGLDAVNVPRGRHLSKDHGDNESVKGRKRFSKRHSKNGLAAVF